MGIDLGDALSALGAGGQAYMGVKNKEKEEANAIAAEERQALDYERKLKFADNLAKDKNERELNEPDPTRDRVIDSETGGKVTVSFSKSGKELARRPSTSFEIEDTNTEKIKSKASLDYILAQTDVMRSNATKSKLEASQYLANEESERSLRAARVRNYDNPQAEATAPTRATAPIAKVSMGEVQSKLVKDFKDLGKELDLSQSDMYEVAKIVTSRVAALKAEGKKVDLRAVMPDAMKAHAAQKTSNPNLKVNF